MLREINCVRIETQSKIDDADYFKTYDGGMLAGVVAEGWRKERGAGSWEVEDRGLLYLCLDSLTDGTLLPAAARCESVRKWHSPRGLDSGSPWLCGEQMWSMGVVRS